MLCFELIILSLGTVSSLRMYYPEAQLGTNPCRLDSGGCQHLCFGLSSTQHVCKCSIGYYVDPQNPRKCLGEAEFLLYSIGHELKGLRLSDVGLQSGEQTRVLGPLSRISLASAIDYHARNDQIFWADNEKGTITSIKRDGTQRNTLIKFFDQFESSTEGWLNGIAVDWVAENIYWSVAKQNLIEVSRLNGSSRYVVLSNVDAPKAIAVDPVAGYLFYAGDKRIGRTGLDGSQLFILANKTSQVTSLAVDINNQVVYWCETNTNVIMRVDYDGNSKIIMLNHSLVHPVAVAVQDKTLYWADNAHENGSIKSAPTSNLSDFTILVSDEGNSLQDLRVFTQQIQKGTNPCATNNGGCSHLCLFNGTHPICTCSHSMLATDGKSCIDYDTFLVYSLITSIDSIHMTDPDNLNSPLPKIRHPKMLRNVIALSYDYERSRIFYSDLSWSTINMVHFNGTNHTVVVSNQPSVEGLAYEAITNSLFWTSNNVASIRSLSFNEMGDVSTWNQTNNNQTVRTIIRLNAHDKLRGLAVESCLSMVYWTNWNSHAASIQRAYLTGYGMESIITTHIRMPNAIALDYENHKLYWADARLDKVERADYDGGNRLVLTHSIPKHPFSIAIYGDLLFWTDWALNSVLRANKFTGTDVVWLRKNIDKPMGIIAIQNTTKSCSASPCEVLNGGCEDVCNVIGGKIKCECTQGKLSADMRSCIRPPGSCSPEQFFCRSGECIPFHLTCDTINHCMDGSDEVLSYCNLRTCPPNFFMCDNHRCILTNETCDGIQHCGDGSDEKMCDCNESHYKCPSGQCIQLKYLCDHDMDCPDAADEMFCPQEECILGHVHCQNSTGCFMEQWRCDGEQDCLDNSDEMNCTKKPCPDDKFDCGDSFCVPMSWRCDHEHDCPNGTADEDNCFWNETSICLRTQFACKNGFECIPVQSVCDHYTDCTDNSDEGEHCHSYCPEDHFHCANSSKCIAQHYVCDGDHDCDEGDDESDCPFGVSRGPCGAEDMFQCSSGICIDVEYYCDGKLDCDDGSDELVECVPSKPDFVHRLNCEDHEFLCDNGKCLPLDVRCNLKDDCGDNSDEDHELCANSTLLCASPQFYRCGKYLVKFPFV